MDQITRINRYEDILSKSTKTINDVKKSLNALKKLEPDIEYLNNYYGSDEWYQDINDDNLGLLPKNIKKGILSEDAIYNLLMDNKEIAIEMLELATNILKK